MTKSENNLQLRERTPTVSAATNSLSEFEPLDTAEQESVVKELASEQASFR